MSESVKHPAKFSDPIIDVIADIVKRYDIQSILDPMCGVGKIAELRTFGYIGKLVGVEIEPEWAAEAAKVMDEVHVGDAAKLFFIMPDTFDAVITSPTYANRMADKLSKDKQIRMTYADYLGRPLTEGNTGAMQWGNPEYGRKHLQIWTQAKKATRDILVVNVSDHYRNKKIQNVVDFHIILINALGMTLVEDIHVKTRRMRRGRNHELRVDHEHVLVFSKHAST